MTRTATRVAAAVGATVVMMGLAAPALACTNTDDASRTTTVVSTQQAKNDLGKVFRTGKHDPALTLADAQATIDAKIGERLAWLDAIEAKVSASDRLSDEQKTAFLAHLQAKEDALTLLRADVAAATDLEGLRAVLKASDVCLFGHHRRHHHGSHHHGFNGGDNDQRHGDNGRSSFNGGNGHHGFQH